MDYAGSSSFFVDYPQDLLNSNLEVRLNVKDINSFLFAIGVFTVVKVVVKDRFEPLISGFLKLY
jgi:uncharacterized protein YqhQ